MVVDGCYIGRTKAKAFKNVICGVVFPRHSEELDVMNMQSMIQDLRQSPFCVIYGEHIRTIDLRGFRIANALSYTNIPTYTLSS